MEGKNLDKDATTDVDIGGLTSDSRAVRRNYLFAALPGAKRDGRDYIQEALALGAAAILARQGTKLADYAPQADVPLVTSSNPRRSLSLMAARFYGRQPATIAAVTGTNGKTSVAHFTRQIWSHEGYKAASLGTLGLHADGWHEDGAHTTPDPVGLHETLAALQKKGFDHLVMEASSHGLEQYRLDGVQLQAAAFTNLSRDHLDYHGDMRHYFDAKMRLFTGLLGAEGTAVLNADSPEGEELRQACVARRLRILTYGRTARDVRLLASTPTGEGQDLRLDLFGRRYDIHLPLAGDFQADNALCALALTVACGVPAEHALKALARLQGAPGRLQKVATHPGGAPVYVDYAHTPEALEKVLSALRPHTKGRLKVVFGCGGERDTGKRPLMGHLAGKLADDVIVTDDNPRGEDAAAIRRQILAGFLPQKGITLREIADRAEAIEAAVRALEPGDALVIAGKGHETYQIIGAQKLPFDDAAQARRAVSAIEKKKT